MITAISAAAIVCTSAAAAHHLCHIRFACVSFLIPVFGLPHGCADLGRQGRPRSCWSRGVHISMDGKGRWPGNVYAERLWRSLKQEEVYWHAYETVGEAKKGIADYLRYFNEERPHQGLDNRTPDDVFYKRKPLPKAA